MHTLVVHTGGNDGHVLEARFVQSLTGEYGVLHGAAVFAVLGKAHGNLVLRNFGVVDEPMERFADVHLAGEADVVMHVFFAEGKGFGAAQDVGFGGQSEEAGEKGGL